MIRRLRPLGRAGNVMLMVALSSVALIGMVALAVDFGHTSVVKGRLDYAADTAALLAASAASNAYKAGQSNPVQIGIAAGQARFDAQAANQTNVAIGQVGVNVTQNGGLFTSTVTYTGTTQTTFARVVGVTSMPVAGQSSASLSLNPFVDIQILMDVSASMLIAATPAAMTQMEQISTNYTIQPGDPGNVAEKCDFACHWRASGTDFYALAKQGNVQLRLTVLQSAVGDVVNTMLTQDTSNRFQLGLYTFSKGFNTAYALSPNLAGAQLALGNIAPDVNNCSNNCPETYFTAGMQQMLQVDQGLNWSGSQVPQRFLFIVTDGVYDQYSSGGARQIGAVSAADCAALKALGVSILVLYTPYTPIPSNSFYQQYVAPVQPSIQPNLQACATTPAYFFVASDAAAINAQMQAMLQLVVQTTSHLTN